MARRFKLVMELRSGKKTKNKSQLVRAHTAEQRECVLKLLDTDMFNWAVDNSVFFFLYRASLCCFEECGEEEEKDGLG